MKLTTDQVITLVISCMGILIIPTLIFLVRATVRWTRVEAKLEEIAQDTLALSKATNERLTWLERHLWKGN